jgi:hypothetical protein
MPDPSLLLRLNGKTLILKDFTTVLAMRSENQQEILAQLREIYDGKFVKVFGTGKTISWTGHVGFLGAVTPVYDAHYAVIGTLGDRFLLFRTDSIDNEEMGLMAQRMVGQEDTMRVELKTAFHQFIDQFKNLDGLHFEQDPTSNHQIVMLACFCAMARCPVSRDYRDRTISYEPLIEGSPQFMQLGMALALINGKDRIDGEVYEIVKKVGRDLLPGRRLNIIRLLWDSECSAETGLWMKTGEVADALSIPGATAKLTCEDMMVIGALQRDRDGHDEKAPYRWRLTRIICDYIKGAALFAVTTNDPF